MDVSRIVSVACMCLLTLCFILSLYAVAVLRNTIVQSTDACREIQSALDAQQSSLTSSAPSTFEDATQDDSIAADVLADRFCMREVNGRIAIYSGDGYLIRLLDISAETLPPADRAALQEGIYVSSWKEILALMQDFGA